MANCSVYGGQLHRLIRWCQAEKEALHEEELALGCPDSVLYFLNGKQKKMFSELLRRFLTVFEEIVADERKEDGEEGLGKEESVSFHFGTDEPRRSKSRSSEFH
jgi:hypothetical protein